MSTSLRAVFIEPVGALRELLVERKALLESILPGQPYTRHPPHCTVLFGAYGARDAGRAALQEKLARVPAFTLSTIAWQEFPADALAGGGHTVALRIRLSGELRQLQLVVASVLAPQRPSRLVSHPLANSEPFATSLRQFGFPFVGDHWIPHFTIGSPHVPAGDPLLARLMSGSARHESEVRSVSLWSVDGEHHERLGEIPLGGA